MSQTLPDVSLSSETTKDQTDVVAFQTAVAAMLHAALDDVDAALHLLRHEALTSDVRYEAQALMYLAREEIEAALRKPGEEDEEPTDA